MSKRNADLLIADMMEALEKIKTYISGFSREQFLSDEKTIDAVVRNLEIIGEAAYRLPDYFRSNHKHIEWYKIAGLRHHIVHDYFGIDLEIIWSILEEDLPLLKKSLQKLNT